MSDPGMGEDQSKIDALGRSLGAYYALDSFGQSKPEVVHLVALIGEVAGGLVFALGVIDWSVEVIPPLTNLACVGGFLPAGVHLLSP